MGTPLLLVAMGSGRSLRRALLLLTCLAVTLPVALGLLTAAAFGGTIPGAVDAGAAVAPMRAWVVTQGFGCTGVVVEPAVAGCAHFHSGIDLAAEYGTPVASVLPGTARVERSASGLGLHVVVAHPGGMTTYYGHLATVAVYDGEAVDAGTVVGAEGSSGNSTGPHLHFEVRRDGVAVPPQEVFPGLFGPGMDNGRR